MTVEPSISLEETPSWSPLAALQRARARWHAFWFTPSDPIGLHSIRFLSGLLFLFWLAPLYGDYTALFGLDGWFGRAGYIAAAQMQGGPPFPVNWSLLFLFAGNPVLLQAFFFASLVVFALFTLGIAPRVTGVLTWLIVVSHLANPALHFDADYLLAILAFYLMIGYLLHGQWGQAASLRDKLLGMPSTFLSPFRRIAAEVPSYAANFAVRLIQVHFAIVIVVSALHKLQHADWWSGVAHWYSLYPAHELTLDKIRSMRASADFTLFWMSLLGYATLAWQLTFPLFAFKSSWRLVLLGGGLAALVGSPLIDRLPYFGPLYFILCLCYLTPLEWHWLHGFWQGSGVKDEQKTYRRYTPKVKKEVGK